MAWRSPARVLRHELTIFALGVFTAVTGHCAAASVFERVTGLEAPGMWSWLLAFAFLTLCFYAVYDNPHPQKLSRWVNAVVVTAGAVPWLLGAAAAIALFGVAALLHHAISGEGIEWRPLLWYLGSLAVFGIGLFYVRNNVLVLHTRYLRAERPGEEANKASGGEVERPRRTRMIAFLSSVSEALRETGYRPSIAWSDPPNLDADLDALLAAETRWPWEMLLRGIREHEGSLCELILVCSRQSERQPPPGRRAAAPSLPQAPFFAMILRSYKAFEKLPISVWAERGSIRAIVDIEKATSAPLKGFDFGHLDEMSSAIADLLKHLRFGKLVRTADILIDFTGGTKPCSVVAAAATLRGEIRAQYVDTNDLVPTTYDLVTNPEVPV